MQCFIVIFFLYIMKVNPVKLPKRNGEREMKGLNYDVEAQVRKANFHTSWVRLEKCFNKVVESAFIKNL